MGHAGPLTMGDPTHSVPTSSSAHEYARLSQSPASAAQSHFEPIDSSFAPPAASPSIRLDVADLAGRHRSVRIARDACVRELRRALGEVTLCVGGALLDESYDQRPLWSVGMVDGCLVHAFPSSRQPGSESGRAAAAARGNGCQPPLGASSACKTQATESSLCRRVESLEVRLTQAMAQIAWLQAELASEKYMRRYSECPETPPLPQRAELPLEDWKFALPEVQYQTQHAWNYCGSSQASSEFPG
ncbi:hypothetical protein AB1Y20_009278 [Prymnesium parvum]|uniref:Uncharacterized protein n=1 Tax=Prymnesium parvum TaxID=97485 RepID=A0AB34K3X2_PRYPA